MISALSHFFIFAKLRGSECPRIDGDPDSRMGGGPAAGRKPRLTWRVCIKG